MNYYSTEHKAPVASLEKAIVKGLAEDKGLYMPEKILPLQPSFIKTMENLSFQEIAFEVARCFFGQDIAPNELKKIVEETLNFDCPVVNIEDDIYTLELFHGPTLAFKDVGARFMARTLQHFIRKERAEQGKTGQTNVLVATSGDTGSAVANGFLGVDGIHVFVLYPKGKVSKIQESQFTTLGKNITAIEVDGTFDDCQALVKRAFMDDDLNQDIQITSANSINVARFLPQAFYYFYAYAQLKRLSKEDIDNKVVFCTPSGNFGNITAGLFTKRMGLPVKRFIAANNANDVFYKYLKTGVYQPQPSIPTIANAMDVGAPSNFARILELYKQSWEAVKKDVHGATYTDDMIKEAIRSCYNSCGYVLDPHGACGYLALKEDLKEGELGIFLETAHPAKFKETVDDILRTDIQIPDRLQDFMKGSKLSLPLANNFEDFKALLFAKATV